MKLNKLHGFLLIALVVYGCANKVMPTGGPKDESPPVLLKADPPLNTVNFSSTSIVLTFNEYVQLKDPAKQIVTSPPILPSPQFTVKKKNVVIELKSPLADNTTYNINFSDAIVDNNETTPLKGFQYTFSTGTYIDSLKVTGRVQDALTLKPADGALVILYHQSTPDSLVLKKTPGYFSRTAADGTFEIRNVAPGTYRMFALLEKNNNYILDHADEKIGFFSELADPSDSSNFVLSLFKPIPGKQSVRSGVFRETGKLMTVFARPVVDLSWKFISKVPDTVLVGYSELKDTVFLYCVPPPADSVQIVWLEKASIIDTVTYLKQRILLTKPPPAFSTGIFHATGNGNLEPETNPVVTWTFPIINIDTSKVKVFIDSTEFPVTISFVDTIRTQMKLEGQWKEGVYKILLQPGAVFDINSLSNDSVFSTFSVPSERSKGSITVMVTPNHQNNYILQLVNDKDEVVRQRAVAGVFKDTFAMLDPATYRLRMVLDINNNGKWDPGDYIENIQPEPVVYYTDPVMVRANWEVELEWKQ